MPKRTDLPVGLTKRVGADGKADWRARVRMKGYPLQTATFESKTKAVAWLERTRSEIKAGRYMPTAEASVARSLT